MIINSAGIFKGSCGRRVLGIPWALGCFYEIRVGCCHFPLCVRQPRLLREGTDRRYARFVAWVSYSIGSVSFRSSVIVCSYSSNRRWLLHYTAENSICARSNSRKM